MKSEKQCQILDCALKVFARFGLKKTSIDDIAKAADISRQGVYLHFKNKDEIFRAAMAHFMDERIQAAHTALAEDKPLEERLLGGLDEWFGHTVGLLHQEASDVIAEGKLQLGEVFHLHSQKFKQDLAQCIVKAGKADKKVAGEVSELLHACGLTWKHEMASREDFRKRMRSAIRICSSSLSS